MMVVTGLPRLRIPGVGLMRRGLTRLHPVMLVGGRMFRLGTVMDMRGGCRLGLDHEA